MNQKVFSFFPLEMAIQLNNQEDWKLRTEAIEELESQLKFELQGENHSPNPDLAPYISDICNKMMKMIHDSNFKISLTAIRIIHLLSINYPNEIRPVFQELIKTLMAKLEDNKIVIRHAILKIFFTIANLIGVDKII